MNVAVLGATGNIGRAIVNEALDRGHAVTAVARNPSRLGYSKDRLRLVVGDVTMGDEVARVVEGHDAVVSAVGPAKGGQPSIIIDVAAALVGGARRARVKRLLVVGGAGSLFVKPGVALVDTPEFPDAWRSIALAHRDALGIYREIKDLDWTYVCPAANVARGARTGRYRLGKDDLLVDEQGHSRISIEDYAVALIDELEGEGHKRTRISVAN